jgi:hypothetical protein
MRARIEHELKTDPEVFEASFRGIKTFEIRYCVDRDFQVGDTVWLRETYYTGEEMKEQYAPSLAEMVGGDTKTRPGKSLQYTGREIHAEIHYIMRGPQYGLLDGWCILSLTRWSRKDNK